MAVFSMKVQFDRTHSADDKIIVEGGLTPGHGTYADLLKWELYVGGVCPEPWTSTHQQFMDGAGGGLQSPAASDDYRIVATIPLDIPTAGDPLAAVEHLSAKIRNALGDGSLVGSGSVVGIEADGDAFEVKQGEEGVFLNLELGGESYSIYRSSAAAVAGGDRLPAIGWFCRSMNKGDGPDGPHASFAEAVSQAKVRHAKAASP